MAFGKSRIILITLALATAGSSSVAGAPLTPDDIAKRAKSKASLSPEEKLATRLTDIWKGPRLRRGTTAIYVVDAKSGEPIFAVHEDEHLNPASNVKLFSTAAALDLLGPDWRYTTRILGPAPDAKGLADGDLYLLGSGDPTLRSKHLDKLVEQIKDSGVSSIAGDIVIGSRTLRDALARASVKVSVTGSRPGKEPAVRIWPEHPLFKIDNQAKSNRRSRGRIKVTLEWVPANDETEKAADASRDGSETAKANDVEPADVPSTGHYIVHVSGRVRRGRTATVWRAVPRRATFTVHTLRHKLIEAGIAVKGGIRVEELDDTIELASNSDYLPVELAKHQSAPVKKLVQWINKPSNNFLADRLLMTVGSAVYGGLPSMSTGIKAMSEWLKNDASIDPDKLTIDTGSGLSYATRITAEQIVHVLRAGAGLDGVDPDGDDQELAPIYLKSLAVAGRDGTLRYRFRRSRTKGHMVGKTGTLTEVIALSGFVSEGKDQEGLCFAIVTNGHKHRLRNRVRKEHEELVEAMHSYVRERRLFRASHTDPTAKAGANAAQAN